MLRDSVAGAAVVVATSNAAGHDNHEKINAWVTFLVWGSAWGRSNIKMKANRKQTAVKLTSSKIPCLKAET